MLVVDREALEARMKGELFMTRGIGALREFILREHFYLARSRAERDGTVKQIIPYVVIHRDGSYFLLRRLKKQTETRLHDRLSLGVGGHINPTEEASADPLEAGMRRELAEEVEVRSIRSLTWAGIINENDGGVSDFHAGLVCLLETGGDVFVRETEKMEGRWASLEEIRGRFDDLETWSQIVLTRLLEPVEKGNGDHQDGVYQEKQKK